MTNQTEIIEYGYGIEAQHITNMQSLVVDNGKVIKLCKGETAWMDAERFASDLFFERQYAR